MIKVKDLEVADDILAIVAEEVTRIRLKGDERDAGDVMKLEKLSRVYSILMASARENLKGGVYGKLSLEELEKLDAQLGESSGSSDPDEELD